MKTGYVEGTAISLIFVIAGLAYFEFIVSTGCLLTLAAQV